MQWRSEALRNGGRAAAALAAAALLSGGCAGPRHGGGLDLGWFAAVDRSPEDDARVRAVGPFYESASTDRGQRVTAVRPFYCLTEDPLRDRRLHEFLWPAGIVKHLKHETHWRFLTGYGHDFDRHDPASRYRGMILPFLFWGRDADGDDYAALFPVGGSIHEFLGRDRIRFILWPLYTYSSVNDVETHDILWPLLSRSTGGAVDRLRVFPFYGRSIKGDDWRKSFVMWPFWTSADYRMPESHGHAYVLWPFYGRVDLSNQQGHMVLPPFFRWSRSDIRREIYCPWPFIQLASGDVDKLYLWPLWGRRTQEHEETHFALWPIVHNRRRLERDTEQHRFLMLPFWHNERTDRIDPSGAGEVHKRYVKLWPLLSYRREEDVMRLRLLDLWPARDVPAVERNLAPLWRLYQHVRVGDTAESELLWGLYRYRRDGNEALRVSLFPLFHIRRDAAADETPHADWSVLQGLLGRRRGPEGDRWRLLWLFNWGD